MGIIGLPSSQTKKVAGGLIQKCSIPRNFAGGSGTTIATDGSYVMRRPAIGGTTIIVMVESESRPSSLRFRAAGIELDQSGKKPVNEMPGILALRVETHRISG